MEYHRYILEYDVDIYFSIFLHLFVEMAKVLYLFFICKMGFILSIKYPRQQKAKDGLSLP